MITMQVYASEMAKFEYDGKSKTVLIAGEGVKGIELAETTDLDPASLVGAKASDPVAIEVGSKWAFREDRPVVESDNGGTFAFLIEVL